MGMIRVSDTVEGRLKELADGRSMNAVIEKMLAYCSSPDGFCPVPREGSYTPTFIERMEQKLDRLEELIKDTTIDRVEMKGRQNPHTPVYVDWEIVKNVFYDFLKEGDQEWVNQTVYDAVHESSDLDMAKFFIKDGHLYIESLSGVKSAALVITPRLAQHLMGMGVDSSSFSC